MIFILDNLLTILRDAIGESWVEVIVVASFILYAIFNIDKIERLSALLSRSFSFISMRAERHTIAADIQSTIKAYRKNDVAGDLLKHGLKFKWVKNEGDPQIKGDNIVVIMSQHNNDAQNFLSAIIQYTELALLTPEVRNEIPPVILSSIMLMMQNKIIKEKKPTALPMFRTNFMEMQITKEPRIKPVVEKLRRMDRNGWFERIYLNEIQYAGARLHELNDVEKTQTLDSFLKFLMTIVEREPEAKVPLDFANRVFGLKIILVARLENAILSNIEAYTYHVKQAAHYKYDSVYVTGAGLNINFTNEVINTIKTRNMATHIWTVKHKHRDRNGTETVLALFRNPTI